ncbi:MAG: hypothetical protein NWE95_02195 [Candidatus Bathyarchaeota archaeon]|nr:hypothetical protein [Candidatus Bathyarchaeota archaeon]
MDTGEHSIYYVLNDETRRRLILALKDKKEVAYTDLLNALQIENTGRLNYHLKVLEGFVSKNSKGNYVLTEKGKVASKLLLGFPENEEELFKQWIVAKLKTRQEPDYLTPAWGLWVVSLISLVILLAFDALNVRTFIFPWLMFFTGLLYLVRYLRETRKRKGFLLTVKKPA